MGEDRGVQGRSLYVVQGESTPGRRSNVSGSHSGLEDEVLVGFRDSVSVVEDRQGSVSTGPKGRGDIYVLGAGVHGVAEQFEQRVFDVVYARRSPADTLDACKAGEAGAEISVGTFQANL